VTEKYVVGGDNVTLTCSVSYSGPETPYIQWTDDLDEEVSGASELTDTGSTAYPDFSTSTMSSDLSTMSSDLSVTSTVRSELSVFVPEDAGYLPSYTCSVRFYSYSQRPGARRYYYYTRRGSGFSRINRYYDYYDNIYMPYNWSSPEVTVSCK